MSNLQQHCSNCARVAPADQHPLEVKSAMACEAMRAGRHPRLRLA